jgi:hypothetical protein
MINYIDHNRKLSNKRMSDFKRIVEGNLQYFLEIGKIIKNIDVKYLIGPKVPNIPLIGMSTKHPNKKEHKMMAKFIKEKLIELYS